MSNCDERILALCREVTAKRPRTVIEHIIQYGFVTTEELKEQHGYNHPPRAVRDVREHGIPLETFRVTGSDGRKIAAYRFGSFEQTRAGKLSGRTVLSKKLKEALLEKHGCRCCIYREELAASELQIDHRIPFAIQGDKTSGELNPDDFMLLSASANRAKSWCCEHCDNWISLKSPAVCAECYWAYPEQYSHTAMRPLRRLDLLWQGEEISQYEALKDRAANQEQEMPAFIKDIISRELKRSGSSSSAE